MKFLNYFKKILIKKGKKISKYKKFNEKKNFYMNYKF